MTQSINGCKVSDKSLKLIFYFSSIRLYIFNICELFNLKITNRGQHIIPDIITGFFQYTSG